MQVLLKKLQQKRERLKQKYPNKLKQGKVIMIDYAFLQGSRDGVVVRVLASQQCGLGLILTCCHM